ncbi:unnamed protein product [Notodromas monacha]|uniref:Uncharacterized protein n=1 Tax=Notodromas monacha TaxID=399045 RepID=A0A7R9GE26_9CRUS|nr:unnamed protein product [Notodromas monacha]CAG0919164.1 unnamed protein product [Notodromas monacha]
MGQEGGIRDRMKVSSRGMRTFGPRLRALIAVVIVVGNVDGQYWNFPTFPFSALTSQRVVPASGSTSSSSASQAFVPPIRVPAGLKLCQSFSSSKHRSTSASLIFSCKSAEKPHEQKVITDLSQITYEEFFDRNPDRFVECFQKFRRKRKQRINMKVLSNLRNLSNALKTSLSLRRGFCTFSAGRQVAQRVKKSNLRRECEKFGDYCPLLVAKCNRSRKTDPRPDYGTESRDCEAFGNDTEAERKKCRKEIHTGKEENITSHRRYIGNNRKETK